MTTCGNFSKFFRTTLRFETLKNFNVFGQFLHLCRKIAPLFPSRKTERKIVQKNFQNFVRLPNIFWLVFAILPAFGVGRTLLCFARVPELRVLSPRCLGLGFVSAASSAARPRYTFINI